MSTWLKVLLVVVGLLVVLVVAAVVVTFVVVRKYGPGIVESVEKMDKEAKEFGRQTDNEGCLSEAVARHSRSEGIGDMIKTNIFLRICLESSRPSPGFCDGVPRQFEFVRSAQWQVEQCRRYNLPTEKQCGQLFQQVQQFCESPRRRAYGDYDSNETDGNANYAPPPPPAPRQTNANRK